MSKSARSTRLEEDAETALPVDPLWYKDAIIYQLHVRSFFDSDDDGIGDFAGLTQKLDYLQDLGVTALWLLPFYPSPLRDDGYDIASYTEVNPAYGDLRTFKRFVREAHARGLRVITELVLNHTSDQHPWFQRARLAKPGSAERNFYVWSDRAERYEDARIIFKDFEVSNWSWDRVAKQYYWHRFYSHQPDLNFENPKVREAMFDVLDYWLRLGVDGLRLDAVPYLYEREGTNCENLPETHQYLKALRRHIDERFPGRMLLAEANQWPEDAIAYFGDGDECQTAFNFPVMPRLFMAVHMEERHPIVDILQQTPPIPDNCQWIVFLRNHDELTLEMVTDEERDYMYRVYARDRQARINLGIRRRLAPLLGNNRRKIELMNGLLCSLPGTPVIYYGDEIGMGDNIYLGDRHGVRTPMQWSPDRNAGFSGANPQRLYSPVIVDSEYLYEAVNVETQQQNPHSLVWWMKRLLALRQRSSVLSRGSLELLAPENPKILAFSRHLGEESVLVVANLSRFVQYVELDLARFVGWRPVEMFGQTRFPLVSKAPYVLTLSPHAFFWFSMERALEEDSSKAAVPTEAPRLIVTAGLPDVLRGKSKKMFEAILVRELPRRRWFHSAARGIQAVSIADLVPLAKASERLTPWLSLVRVEYVEGEAESYLLPLVSAWGNPAQQHGESSAAPVIAQLQGKSPREIGILWDGSLDPAVGGAMLDFMQRRRHLAGAHGELVGWADSELNEQTENSARPLASSAIGPGQSNSVLAFDEKVVLKILHRVETGINPELEVGRFLSERAAFPHTPPLLGAIEHRLKTGDSVALAVLHAYVPGAVTGWQFCQDALGRLFEDVMAQTTEARPGEMRPAAHSTFWDHSQGSVPQIAQDLLGGSLEWATQLGHRTAQLHLALASDRKDPAFAPEPFTQLYQRSIYQSSRKLTLRTFQQLRRRLGGLTNETQAVAREALDREKPILEKLRAVVGVKLSGRRIRCHGNFHLGHILYTGKDIYVIDFGGEPGTSLATRRIKSAALEDVAGMIHSFYSAAAHAVLGLTKIGFATPDKLTAWQQASDFWSLWSSSALLRAYATSLSETDLLPSSGAEIDLLVQLHVLHKTMRELQFAINQAGESLVGPLATLLKVSGP